MITFNNIKGRLKDRQAVTVDSFKCRPVNEGQVNRAIWGSNVFFRFYYKETEEKRGGEGGK